MLLMVNLAPDVTCQFFFFLRLEPVIDTMSRENHTFFFSHLPLLFCTYSLTDVMVMQIYL